jgi:hypothetical protein
MGPGTYFLRVILEGGRGDNMRDLASNKKKNLTSDDNENGEGENGGEGGGEGEKGSWGSHDDGEDERTTPEMRNREKDTEKAETSTNENENAEKEEKDGNCLKKNVQKELEHAEDLVPTIEGKRVTSLAEHGDIKRIIFCSGKVRMYYCTVRYLPCF